MLYFPIYIYIYHRARASARLENGYDDDKLLYGITDTHSYQDSLWSKQHDEKKNNNNNKKQDRSTIWPGIHSIKSQQIMPEQISKGNLCRLLQFENNRKKKYRRRNRWYCFNL